MNVLRTFIYPASPMTTAADLLVLMARDNGAPVISEFELYALAVRLFRDQRYLDIPIPPRNRTLTQRRARKLISQATWQPQWSYAERPPANQLPRDPDFSSILYTAGPGDARSVILAADPFCCLSHGSALAFHGIAAPSHELHVSTPDRHTWQAQAKRTMEEVIGFPPDEADEEDLPYRMKRPVPLPEVRGEEIRRHERKGPIAFVCAQGIRTTVIGDTFRDALDNPGWCGGIEAVIALWREHAAAHLDAIIEAVSASNDKILRVRAGYLLDEVIGIKNPRIDAWEADAQRGSSRKLDASAPYASNFSARWMLSINVPDASLPSTRKP